MADTNENEEILFPQDEEDNSPVEEVEVTEEVAEEVNLSRSHLSRISKKGGKG